jgi:hypothetical protein
LGKCGVITGASRPVPNGQVLGGSEQGFSCPNPLAGKLRGRPERYSARLIRLRQRRTQSYGGYLS